MTEPTPHAWLATAECLGESAQPGFPEWALRVPANFTGLDGHVPNFLGRRFNGPLRPAQAFRLTAEPSASGNTINFRLRTEGRHQGRDAPALKEPESAS